MTRGTVPDPYDVIARLRASNAVLRQELQAAGNPRRAFWYGIVIGGVVIGASFGAGAAFGQGAYKCEPPDRITIQDDGPGRAIVTYYNSINDCSNHVDRVLESANGIAVRVIIEVGGEEHDYRELITLEPQDALMMAFPPEGALLDGEERQFVIQGGLS